MTFEELLSMLKTITDTTTIEEVRRINAEVIENFENQINDNTNIIKALRQDLLNRDTEIKNLSDEIDRLKEENGRLYRERVFTKKDVDNDVDIDISEEIRKLEKEIIF